MDLATNRMSGYVYDANGNQTTAPGGGPLSYNVENRVGSSLPSTKFAGAKREHRTSSLTA